MPGLRFILSPLFLTAIAAASQHTLTAAAPTQLITSSVKLRVDAANGHDWGTGTIIDTRQSARGQEALILTCGHIFQAWGPQFSKELHGNRHVEVHLFSENSTVKIYGECLIYDTEIDLALVAVTTPCPVQAVPIAPISYRIQPSQQTWSVGCDHGGNPTVRAHQIMSIDRISTPRENRVPFQYVQVSGAPVSGRSGGGLFTAEGYLVGVCNTGDPSRNDGHFVPPQMIRHILDQMNLADIYKNPSLGVPTTPPAAPTLAALTPLAPMENIQPMAAAGVPMPMVADNRVGMSREEQATLEEIKRWQQDGDEVILIRRSIRNPEIPSDVIVLNRVSDQFIDALVKSPPPQMGNPSYNPVILSSQTEGQTSRQPVSLPVRY